MTRAWALAFFAALGLYKLAAARHALHMSGAYDLSCFDQPLWLLSQGLPPYSTIMELPFLGDHAAWALYPLALVYAGPPMLFALQAAGLAAGAIAAAALVHQAGGTERQTLGMAGIYLAYPLVFNANLFDFHPDALVPALILGALWAARARRWLPFLACILVATGCKEIMGLSVAALGAWLVLGEGRRAMGATAVATGLGGLLAAVLWIIPAWSGAAPAAASRYAYLAQGPAAWAAHLAQPDLYLYVLYLVAPLAWAWRQPIALAALPALAVNLLAAWPAQHDLVHHYALPILPFLIAAAADALASQKAPSPRVLAGFALVGFLALAKPGYFFGPYLAHRDTLAATNAAIDLVPPTARVLTTHELAPHLAHRPVIRFTDAAKRVDLAGYDAVLLDARHPGWRSDAAYDADVRGMLARDPAFRRVFDQDGVGLWLRSAP